MGDGEQSKFGKSRVTLAAVLWAALILLALATLSPSQAHTPERIYYAMEFDAEIEGERFTFETKVACWTKLEIVLDSGEKNTLWRRPPRMADGKKLKSGKGVFVAAPRICKHYFSKPKRGLAPQWVLSEKEKSILPSIYVTDDYDNANFLTFYSNPNGPNPDTGVNLIQCVVRPITEAEADQISERKPDPNDPFLQGIRESWRAYSFFRLSDEDSEIVQTNLDEVILETPRYRLHRQPMRLTKMFRGVTVPLIYAAPYVEAINNTIPLNDAVEKFRPRSYMADFYNEATTATGRIGFSTNYPLMFDKKVFTVDFANTGVLRVFSPRIHQKYLFRKPIQKLMVDGAETEFDWGSNHHRLLLLHDLETGHLYSMYRTFLKINP